MFTFWTFFCAVQTFSNFHDFFFKTHFFYEFQIELKQWVFLQSIWFFVLVKADVPYFTMVKFMTQSHHIPSSYLDFKCAFFHKNICFSEKKWKKCAFNLGFGRMSNGLHIWKERPIFNLELSWFIFATLQTSCKNKWPNEPHGRWNECPRIPHTPRLIVYAGP